MVVSPYLFTAKVLDEETGICCYGARYYDPRTSVWLSVDPIDRFRTSLASEDGIRYLREVDVGRQIGFDKMDGNNPTSVTTIMTDTYGNLVSTFPGVLK